jgi:hypothetical protein
LKSRRNSKKLEEDNGEIDGVDGSETERSLDDKRSQDIADRKQKFAEKSAPGQQSRNHNDIKKPRKPNCIASPAGHNAIETHFEDSSNRHISLLRRMQISWHFQREVKQYTQKTRKQ